MNDIRFWSLVDRIGPDLCMARLAMTLGSLPVRQALAFSWQAKLAASALATPAHRRWARTAREHRLPDPEHRLALVTPVSDTAPLLEDLQLTEVALGRDAWSAVVAAPTLLEASWPVELGRQLGDALRSAPGTDLPLLEQTA